MFAIAIWDQKEQTLELVRDRIGVKPLYYSWCDRVFCFASELKGLRQFKHWQPTLNRQALGEFLQYGHISRDRSIYEHAKKLPPGHRLRIAKGGEPVVEAYWSVISNVEEPFAIGDQSIESDLEELLIDACRYRMVSDVPVGLFLSGGVDSSLVTALLSKNYDSQIRTFTIGFSEDSHNEASWARRVAKHCRTEHREHILDVSEALKIAEDWGRLFDEPFGDSSGIPTLLVSRLAADEVKVVLSADGGDELFSGYNSYSSVLRRLERLQRVPSKVLHAAGKITGSPWFENISEGILSGLRLPPSKRGAYKRRIKRLPKIFSAPTPGGLIDLDMSYWYPDEIVRCLGEYSSPRLSADTFPGSPADQIALWDFHNYLPDDIMTKVDRTTMATSIEGREPLLDHRIAEFAFRLPGHLKRGHLGPKHILKKILYRYVPQQLVDRPKQGFAIPLEKWLASDLKQLVQDYLSSTRIRQAGIMDPETVDSVVTDFYAGDGLQASRVWHLLAFEMWRENWG
jgi:asparagine synthase (glutamine-hydrolysing)